MIKLDRTYLKNIFYIVLTATAIFIMYNIIFNIVSVLSFVSNIIHIAIKLMTPFIIGCIIAYLLYPITDFIDRVLERIIKKEKNPYLASVILTYVFVIVVFVLMIYSIYAIIGGQLSGNNNLSNMLKSIGVYIQRYNEIFQYVNSKLIESGLSEEAKKYLSGAVSQINTYIALSIQGIVDYIRNIGSNVLNIFLGLFLSFYFIKDYRFFKSVYKRFMLIFVSEHTLTNINSNLKEVNGVISSFIRGQLTDGLIVGLISCIGLTLLGLDFAFLIGFTAGLANIIPYLGPIIGAIPAVIVGLLSGDPVKAVWAVLILIGVQQLDGAVIAPRVVGGSVGIHPVFVMLAIVIGGYFAGIIGMLVSVPVAGIIKLFVNKYLHARGI